MSEDSAEMIPAGREIDLLVAESIMNLLWVNDPDTRGARGFPPPFSTEIEAAWTIAEHLNCCVDLTIICGTPKRYFARLYPKDDVEIKAEAETMPLAICRAALMLKRREQNVR
jgi:hypothetical protein